MLIKAILIIVLLAVAVSILVAVFLWGNSI